MTLSLDRIVVPVSEVRNANAFYSAVFASTAEELDDHVRLDMQGRGRIDLRGPTTGGTDDASASDPGGCVLNYIVDQPSEVAALLAAAERDGATTLKPAKKGFFGGFTAVFQVADGTVWKLAAPTRKDTGPVDDPPTPTEIVGILGVAEPKVSKTFYEALGMTVDRDYGNKFVDFEFETETWRLGLMPAKELAKDAGIEEGLGAAGSVQLISAAESRDEVDTVLAAAAAAGGRIVTPAQVGDDGCYTGDFTDPDGHRWAVAAPAD